MWKSKIAAAPAAIRQFCTHVPVKAKLACIVFLGLLSLRWWMLQNEAIADADRALSLLSQDMAIVAACRNRNQHLLTSLASWRSVPNAGIFIVDWGSSTPVLDALRTAASSSAQSNEEATTQAKPARIHVVRIDPSNATSWRLSSAVNLAASMVDGGQSSSNCIDCSLSQNINATYLLKLDCDHKLDAEFLQRNRDALLQMTQSKAFLAGNWAASRTENDLHVNGAVLLKREAFQEVNGYDERFDTYGFDDEDLYRRLAKAGYQRLDFALDSVLHIQHSDKLRDLSSAVQVPSCRVLLSLW